MVSEGRSRGLDRLVNFSDAVVAIASTLLVLPLVELATSIGKESGESLTWADLGPQLFVFVLSFVVIARYWSFHHTMFEPVVDYSAALVWVNTVWLISIAFLPFPTELLVHDFDQRWTAPLYVGTLLLTTVSSAASKWLLIRAPGLLDPPQPMREVAPYLSAVLLVGVAFLVSLAWPALGVLALLLLLLSGWLERPIRRFIAARSSSA